MVKCSLGNTFSTAFRPLAFAHSAGGRASRGTASALSSIDEKFCRRRMSMKDISLYANLEKGGY